MSLAARSPRSRKSLSLSEHDLNHLPHQGESDNLALPVDGGGSKKSLHFKKRGVSIGGEGLSSLSSFTPTPSAVPSSLKTPASTLFPDGTGGSGGGKNDELSPRRKARRSMQPRKSILKGGLNMSISGPSNSANDNDDVTTDFTTMTHQYAHTIAFPPFPSDDTTRQGRPSLARRVSFAPNAHVRMFEPAPKGSSAKDNHRHSLNIFSATPAMTGPRSTPVPSSSSSSSHHRRSSIQNISSIKAPSSPLPGGSKSPVKSASILSPRPTTVVIVSEDFGEESMEIESLSGESDELEVDGAVEMGPRGSYQVRDEGDLDAEGEDVEIEDEEGEVNEEEEIDMDETGVYGGIIRRQSIGGGVQITVQAADTGLSTEISEGDSQNVDSIAGDDEEKTMDFTIAVGGVVPSLPPINATAGRASIGYSVPQPTDGERLIPGQGSDALDGEMEIEMDETVAYGGIIQADDSLSSADDTVNSRVNGDGGVERERTMTFSLGPSNNDADDDDGMDMTVAHGGIVSFPNINSNVPPTPLRSPMPSNTRPMGGTPSFARPTQSSIQKSKEKTIEKRNVFAPSPSPSPTKGGATPIIGMAAAGDVAKRLSFGSTTSSGGKRKRSTEDNQKDEEEGGNENGQNPMMSASKRLKILSTDEIFSAPTPLPPGPLNSLPRRSLGTPRRSLGTPIRLKSPAVGSIAYASPSANAALLASVERVAIGRPSAGRDDYDAENLEEDQAEEEEGEGEVQREWDETPPTITLASFLEMAGVQFMESLPLLNRRRSSVGRGLLGQGYVASDREYGLHDYTEAQLHSIFLNMYNWASDKMKEDIRLGQEELDIAEENCAIENPPVIRDYLGAPDEDRPLFEMTFKTFKTNTHLKARERWYDWKLNLMERIRPDVEDVLNGMQEDNERLTAQREQADSILPDLQARHATLVAELEKERSIVSEISACDQTELAELKAGVEEQNAQIQVFKQDLEESTAKANDLESKLEELNIVKEEHKAAIQLARSKCDKFTRSDVARLQEEYKSLQHLHMWKPTRINTNSVQLEFDGEIQLSIPCSSHVPNLSGASLSLIIAKDIVVKENNGFGLTEALFELVSEDVKKMSGRERSLSQLVRRVGQLWTAAQRLRQETRVLAFRHPLIYKFNPSTSLSSTKTQDGQGNVTITATIILPTRAKIAVDFVVGVEQLIMWPEGVADVTVAARTIYGSADARAFASIVEETVKSAVAYVPGVFVQGCVDAAVACT